MRVDKRYTTKSILGEEGIRRLQQLKDCQHPIAKHQDGKEICVCCGTVLNVFLEEETRQLLTVEEYQQVIQGLVGYRNYVKQVLPSQPEMEVQLETMENLLKKLSIGNPLGEQLISTHERGVTELQVCNGCNIPVTIGEDGHGVEAYWFEGEVFCLDCLLEKMLPVLIERGLLVPVSPVKMET